MKVKALEFQKLSLIQCDSLSIKPIVLCYVLVHSLCNPDYNLILHSSDLRLHSFFDFDLKLLIKRQFTDLNYH